MTEILRHAVSASRFGIAFTACLLTLLTSIRDARAAGTPAPPPPTTVAPAPDTVSAPELGRSIEDVLRRREYVWRSPRAANSPATAGSVDAFFDRIGRWVKERQTEFGRWFEHVAKKWRGWFRSREQTKPEETPAAGLDPATLKTVLYGAIALLAVGLGFLAWRQFRWARSGTAESRAAPAAVSAPDLTDDSVLATELPEDEWLLLARRLADGGQRRLALRAFYLSILAALGKRGLLAIARHKSNRDYLLELRRRARDHREMQGAFARNVQRFERVWYGEHDADDGLLAAFQADREVVLG